MVSLPFNKFIPEGSFFLFFFWGGGRICRPFLCLCYVAHLRFMRSVKTRTQIVFVASGRATDVASYILYLATHPSYLVTHPT
jgi:hypothetical protein